MCIGINPVFSPSPSSQAATPVVNRTDRNVPAIRSMAATPPSRKRPLKDDGRGKEEGGSSTRIPSTSKRSRLMRYSTCTTSSETCHSLEECTKQQDRPRRNSNRRVHFGGFKTFVPSPHSFSAEDVQQLWYGLDECSELNEISKNCVRQYRERHCKDTLRHVLCVASQCSYNPPPLAYLQAVRLNLPEEARGLELGLLPLRVRQRRHEHVRKVIQVQHSIVEGKIPLKHDEQVKAKALAVQAMRSSQASQLFAQLVARNVAQEEQEQRDGEAIVSGKL